MWVVKLGGSLHRDPALPQWLALLAQLGGGRVTVVGGGGRFADEVRLSQDHWHFDDLAAHNMAVLAMLQTAYLMHALQPSLQMAQHQADIARVLHKGQAALWLPMDLLATQADASTNWDVTSDSIALDLARRLNAERLVLVKSCRVDPLASWAQLGDDGVVDRQFAQRSQGAAFPIDLIHKDDLAQMRSLLLGEARTPV